MITIIVFKFYEILKRFVLNSTKNKKEFIQLKEIEKSKSDTRDSIDDQMELIHSLSNLTDNKINLDQKKQPKTQNKIDNVNKFLGPGELL